MNANGVATVAQQEVGGQVEKVKRTRFSVKLKLSPLFDESSHPDSELEWWFVQGLSREQPVEAGVIS